MKLCVEIRNENKCPPVVVEVVVVFAKSPYSKGEAGGRINIINRQTCRNLLQHNRRFPDLFDSRQYVSPISRVALRHGKRQSQEPE